MTFFREVWHDYQSEVTYDLQKMGVNVRHVFTEEVDIFFVVDLLKEIMKDPSSHLYASYHQVPPMTREEMRLVQVYNAVIGTSNLKDNAKRKAIQELPKPKTRKRKSRKMTKAEAQQRFAHVKIKGKNVDISTGEIIE